MNSDSRGGILRLGSVLQVQNALVEEVYHRGRTTGYLLVSYAIPMSNGRVDIEQLRLNVNGDTQIINSIGLPMCICEIRKGMWVDALFSPVMTRSIPPQSNAFFIIARRGIETSLNETTDRVAFVDNKNNFFYTGNPFNVNEQMRFVLADGAVIHDRDGNPVPLRSLRKGQMVKVTHASFSTASIPPQTTAFHVQII